MSAISPPGDLDCFYACFVCSFFFVRPDNRCAIRMTERAESEKIDKTDTELKETHIIHQDLKFRPEPTALRRLSIPPLH